MRRAREWTPALAEWWAEQPEMVAFTGRCLVHRAEILQLDGSWHDALAEARRAGERFVETGIAPPGSRCYRQGELLRLQGDFAAAEEAYRKASSSAGAAAGPGPAAPRTGPHRGSRRGDPARGQRRRRAGRARALLPAFVEIMLEAETQRPVEPAGARADRDAGTRARCWAMVAHARGAMHLAEGEPREALVALRKAGETWQELDTPYEIARTRVLVGDACRLLGDEERRGRSTRRRGASSSGSARSPISRDSRRRRGRHGLSRRELEVLRLSPQARRIARSRRRS